jgi:hypothetical protein
MKKIYLLLILSWSVFSVGNSQSPPWFFINTGVENTHIMLILENTPMLLDGQPLEVGDYIGAFYEILDTLICGTGTGNTGDIGGLMITNTVAAATMWGAEPNVSNGFQVGEEFKWKIWRARDGSVFDATVEYDTTVPNITDSGFYVTNGISKMASLSSFSIPGIDLSVNKQLSPLSGCGSLEGQPVSVILENHDTLDIIGFDVFYTLDGGDTISEFVNDTIYAGSTYEYTFSQMVSLTNVGEYHFHVWVNFPGDVNYTNDFNNKEVIISEFPEVDLGDDVFICEGESALLQTDTFFSEYLWNNGSDMQFLYTSEEGFYYCTITDDLGCQGFDSVYVDVLELPQFYLPDTVKFCEGLNTTVTIEGRFESFKWSNGITKPALYISIPNMYSVTVTDAVGCSSVDSLVAMTIPVPQVDLGDTIYSDVLDTIYIDAGPDFTSYYWSNGAFDRIITPSQHGIYTVTVSDGDCDGTGSIWLKQDTVKFFEELHVWPNPSSGLLTFYLPKTEKLSVEIFNFLGQQLVSEDLEADNIMEYNATWLRSGAYVLIVNTDKQRFKKRLIIAK